MNKVIIFFTLLSAMVMLASCAKTDIEEELRFTIETLQAETKGTPILGTGFPNGGTFTIYGYNKTGNSYSTFLDGITATVSGSDVVLTGAPYYWPLASDGTVFYCIHPQTSTGLVVASDPATPSMSIAYEVPTAFDDQKDILYVRKTDAAYQQGVALKFKHLLARVTFQCRLKANTLNTTVKVNSITLKNAVSKGTLTLTSSDETWTNETAATADYSIILGDKAKVIGSSYDKTVDSHSDGNENDNEQNYTNIFIDAYANNSFLMIPADVAQLNQMTLELTININGTDIIFTNNNMGTITENLINTGWEKGKHVNYRFEIDMSKEVFELKIVSVSVENWGTKQDIDLGMEI